MTNAPGGILEQVLANPWATLRPVVDGPLHPGGIDASKTLLDRAAVDAQTRLLDMGCGQGASLSLARKRGATAVGLDRHPAVIGPATSDASNRANQSTELPGGSAEFESVQGAMTAVPIADDAFDVVLAECVLCLAEDLDTAVLEAHRILNPTGRLAMSEVVLDGEPPTVPEPIEELLCLTGARHRAELLDTVAAAGFSVSSVSDHGDDLLSMRDRIAAHVDYEGLLAASGERGRSLRDGISTVENAVAAGRIGYISLIAEPG